MLLRFGIKNFKSFRDAELQLRPLTVLIGANASGKTNFLEALQLLSWIASGRQLPQILSAVRDEELNLRGTLPQLTHDGSEAPIEFQCILSHPNERNPWIIEFQLGIAIDDPDGPKVVREQLKTSNPPTDILLYVAELEPQAPHTLRIEYNDFARGGNKPRLEGSALQAVVTQLTSSARFAENHEKAQKIIPEASRGVALTLQQILVLDPVPQRMRGYSHVLDRNLRSDGANVSAVLHELCKSESRDLVLEFVRALPEQDIAGVDFVETPRGEVMVALQETFGGKLMQRDAATLSDGTLRVLAVVAALLSVPETSTVVIEEVDNGIHPPRVARLLELMQEVADRRQLHLLLTTHNPALLDAIPLRDLQHVVVCYRDPVSGESRLVPLGELSRFPELVAQGSLGQLVTRGVVERILHEGDDEERREDQDLEWLKSLEASS